MKSPKVALHLLLALGALAGASCSSKSPTEPTGGGTRNPIPPPTLASFNVTVTANPGQITVGSATGATINVRVTTVGTGAPPADATPVTLATTLGNFGSASGPQTTILQLVGGAASAVLFAGTSVGTAAVTASISCTGCTTSTGATSVRIISAGTFFLSSVTPNIGNATGGDQVTINGGGFAAPARVTFNGTPATVVAINPSAITVLTPSAAAAGVTVGVGQTVPVPVGVTINLNQPNQASDTLTNGFTYALGGQPQQPQVFSLNPASGPDQGGTRVNIVGQGFQAPVQVFFGSGTAGAFNGIEATVQSVTATQIVVLTPSASGFGQNNVDKVVDVLVKNVNSGFNTVATQAFKYGSSVLFTSLAPNTTEWNMPIKVTLFGQGFQDPIAADLAGVGVGTVLATSGTEIQVLSGIPVLTGCSPISGPSHEVNINTGQGAAGPIFTYTVSKPIVTGITPIFGPQNGGTVVTISGVHFDNPFASVLFGTESAPVITENGSTITVTAPAFTGTFLTAPCTGAGGVQGTVNVPTSVDVTVTNNDTTCSFVAKQAFTYDPNDVTCHAAPPPPPPPVVASFTFSQATGSFTVLFHDTSTGTPTAWAWTFGDGGTSALQNPNHLYTSAGTFTVTLTASGAGGMSSVSMFVTVPGT